MRKAAMVALALAVSMSLWGCTTSMMTTIDNTLSATVTGSKSDDEASSIVVGANEALAIEHDIKKGVFVVRVKCMGDDVFNDDVAGYDGTIYVPEAHGTCNVAIYTEDTEGSIKVYACDASEAKAASTAKGANATQQASLEGMGEHYSKGEISDGVYRHSGVGVEYTLPSELTLMAEEKLALYDIYGMSYEFFGDTKNNDNVLCTIRSAEVYPVTTDDDSIEFMARSLLKEMEGMGMRDPSVSQEVYKIGDHACVRLHASWKDDDKTGYRTLLYIPRDEYVAVFSSNSFDEQRADELLQGITLT